MFCGLSPAGSGNFGQKRHSGGRGAPLLAATAPRYFGVQFNLEDLLGMPVDLVTEKALRPRLRPFVEKDLARV
jgi:hypothetical protein